MHLQTRMDLPYLRYLQGVTQAEISERGTGSTSTRKHRQFSADEIAWLQQHADGRYTAKEMATLLGRPSCSIRRKVQSMGLMCKGHVTGARYAHE